METRFAHLRQRDNSVDMLRVKMSRRRSQSQKENRDRALNTRRLLDKLPELDCSTLDTSVRALSAIKITGQNVKLSAAEERMKLLARYKEAKELQKEKERREKERKGVFKVGLYHPQQAFPFRPLPQVPAATSKAKAPVTSAGRMTRSKMKQVQNKVPQPQAERETSSAAARKAAPAVARTTRSRATVVKPPPPPATSRTRVAIVEPVPRAPSTRLAGRSQPPVASVIKDPPAAGEASSSGTGLNMKQSAAPPSGRGGNTQKEAERTAGRAPRRTPSGEEEEEEMVKDPAPAPVPDPAPAPPSFAPQNFIFQAPVGLSSFQPNPLTPRSAQAFFTPSCVFSLPPVPLFFPLDDPEPGAELSAPSPPKSPLRSSPPRPSLALAPPVSPQEPQHDVAYFRSVMVSETERLSGLSEQWNPRVDDPSIPEEMRDRMRTVVGQARLLMKERFGQFGGLVDDCELGRGEKITTCTDLQGFWEMVYYQVEDVNRKFAALTEAESRGWQEEQKSPPRQRKAAKKPARAAASKPSGGRGISDGAKSRLATIKAAMKAKLAAAEAEKAAQAAGSAVDDPAPQDPQGQAQIQAPETVMFDGGFFQVESPAKLAGPVRRSSRLSRAATPQPSPCPASKLSTPAGTRCSGTPHPRLLLLARTPVRLTPAHTPDRLKFPVAGSPQPSPGRGPSLFPRDDPEPGAEPSAPSPPKSPLRSSPPRASLSLAPPVSPQEPQHDVAYFRSVMVIETERLTGLSEQWIPRVDDPSIPEEMRDRMRTVVGQARLLMKERFGQFGGLVDDCELGRGEKITTCTDLQGFWEMVYYQVEDVNRKFAALTEAESRGWQEEQKSPPRQRKAAKKPGRAAASKPSGAPGLSAGAKSRLATIKAAMKAKLAAAEAEKAAQAAGSAVDDPAPQDPQGQDPDQAQTQSQAPETVMFDGGFFQVESPAKLPGPTRRSSRLSGAQPSSPCPASKLSTPARTRRSNAASPGLLPLLARTPARLRFSLARTPQSQARTAPVPEEPDQSDGLVAPEPGSPAPVRSVPSTPARQARAASPEACDTSLSLTTSLYPSLPLSPPNHGPEWSSPAGSPAPSFSLSPRRPSRPTPARGDAVLPPPLSSPGLRSSSPPAIRLSSPASLSGLGGGDSSLVDADVSMTVTPDSSIVEGVQGLDFERYLQPAARCSLSPQGSVAAEMPSPQGSVAIEMSPAATDVEMESPVAQSGETTLENMMTPTAFPRAAHMLTPRTPQAADNYLMFFSPDPRDRIRQSVCPSELMVFTPPSKR